MVWGVGVVCWVENLEIVQISSHIPSLRGPRFRMPSPTLAPYHPGRFLRVPTSSFHRVRYSCPNIDRGRKEKTVPIVERIIDIASRAYM